MKVVVIHANLEIFLTLYWIAEYLSWRGQNGQVLCQWQVGKSSASGTWAEVEEPSKPHMEVGIAPPSVPWVGEQAWRQVAWPPCCQQFFPFTHITTPHQPLHFFEQKAQFCPQISRNKRPYFPVQKDSLSIDTYGFSFWSELAQTCWLPHAHEIAFPKTRSQETFCWLHRMSHNNPWQGSHSGNNLF